MTLRSRRIRRAAVAGLVATALSTSACGTDHAGQGGDDEQIDVAASTSVWGSVAEAVGGEAVDVESIIDSAGADPHSYESTPRDAVTVDNADLVVFNGGGYDGFIEQILSSSGRELPSVRAVEGGESSQAQEEHAGAGGHEGRGGGADRASPDHAGHSHDDQQGHDGHSRGATSHEGHSHESHESHGESEHANHERGGNEGHSGGAHEDHGHSGHEDHSHGGHDHSSHDHSGNEHVWYDLHVAHETAERVAGELAELQPDKAQQFHDAAARFSEHAGGLEARVGQIAAHHGGAPVLATEPVAHYLIERAGLRDVTPQEFVGSVESGNDPSALAVAEIQDAVDSGRIAALIYNPQTESPLTKQIRARAEQNHIPVVEMTETLPAGTDYLQWMESQVSDLERALNRKR